MPPADPARFKGLSVAAITYYVAALLHYELKAIHGIVLRLDPDSVLPFAVPLFAIVIWRVVRSKRHSVT